MIFHKHLYDLPVYEAGKPLEEVVANYDIFPSDIIKLGSNENPLGVPPSARDAIVQNAHLASIYPDDSYAELKRALSKRYDVREENLIIGSGSDQILEFCVRAACDSGRSTLMAKTTFAMYEIYSRQCNAKVIKTPDFFHNLDSMFELYREHKPALIFICTPNNPLGEALKKSEVLKFLSKLDEDCLVVLDCAYMEYCSYKDPEYAISPREILGFPGVIYLGTFSKIYGLGGLRVGYGVANSDLVRILNKLRPPFNITTLSLKAATASLNDCGFLSQTLENNFNEMSKYRDFAVKHGLNMLDSYGNFVTLLLNDGLNSTRISALLLQQGIVIRDLASYGLNAVRVTIGRPEQNDKLLERLSGVLALF